MIVATDDMLIAVVAAGMRRAPRRPRRSRRDHRAAITRALAAWKRVRLELFAGVRSVS